MPHGHIKPRAGRDGTHYWEWLPIRGYQIGHMNAQKKPLFCGAIFNVGNMAALNKRVVSFGVPFFPPSG